MLSYPAGNGIESIGRESTVEVDGAVASGVVDGWVIMGT
jgi:hypothetical protein